MKSLKLILFGTALFLAVATKAQVSVNVNLGVAPMWGPVGYSDVQYYYLPDVYAYYDINASMFIYQSNGVWIHRSYLPDRYRNYDLYNGYKVVMNDYHGSRPYYHYNDYRRKYARGYHGPEQHNIGARPEHGYSGTRGHINRPSHVPNHENFRPARHGNVPNNGHGNMQNNRHENVPNNGHGNVKSNGHGNVQNSGHGNNNQKKSNGNGNGRGNGNGKGNGKK